FREFKNTRGCLRVRRMTLGDEELSVRHDVDGVGLPEIFRITTTARLTDGEKDLPVGAELENLMAFRRTLRSGGRRRRASSPTAATAGARAVDHPDVVVVIDENPVRRFYEPGSEVSDQVAILVELEDGIERRSNARVRSASLGHPDALSVAID